jgi:hypothetical protein
MAIVRQISVFLENQPGRLGSLCDVLADEGVNIEAIMVPSGTDYGIVHLVVDRPEDALRALEQRAYRTYTSHVLDLRIANHPGALAKIADKLAELGIDVKYAYSAVYDTGGRVILAVSDAERARGELEGASEPASE